MAIMIDEVEVMYDEIVLVYSSERAGIFHGVDVRFRTMIVFAMVGRCDEKVSNTNK